MLALGARRNKIPSSGHWQVTLFIDIPVDGTSLHLMV